MYRSTSSEDLNSRLHLYLSSDADEMKQKMLDREAGVNTLAAIGDSLLNALNLGPIVPVLILRGGLALWEPCRNVIGCGPMGIIVPVRTRHEDIPEIAYASLPVVRRLSDWISLGVLASWVPRDAVDEAVEATGKGAKRKGGKLPPHVMVYFAMALALFAGEVTRRPGSGCRRPWRTGAAGTRRRPR